MNAQLEVFNSTQVANKELKDAINKLMDLVRNTGADRGAKYY
eukprot:SAG11_NODE_2880_length_2875_cov_3.094020_1_plen_42_part_00